MFSEKNKKYNYKNGKNIISISNSINEVNNNIYSYNKIITIIETNKNKEDSYFLAAGIDNENKNPIIKLYKLLVN